MDITPDAPDANQSDKDSIQQTPQNQPVDTHPFFASETKKVQVTDPSVPVINYNVPQVTDFLSLVFGQVPDEENVLTWYTDLAGHPSFPYEVDKLINDRLARTTSAKRLYFGTATCKRHIDGGLYNRKALFQRLYVVVLDDIGTKVPVDSLPEELRNPTYIIESSPGNFQYGYVLKTPIADLTIAENVIRVIYGSGLTDSGGALVTKLVRLPEGLHSNKLFSGEHHRVKLVHMDGPYWEAEALVKACDAGVTWDDIVNSTRGVQTVRGTTPWSPVVSESERADGITDPVLDWLYEKNVVVQELNNGWVQIECIQKKEHTDGNDFAYYSPLGAGGPEFELRRGYKCFHSHDDTPISTSDMLGWVARAGGPEMPAFDPVSKMLRDYVYDAVEDGVWEITTPHSPVFLKTAAFRNLHIDPIYYTSAENKPKVTTSASMWLKDARRVSTHGKTHDVSDANRVVTDPNHKLRVNTFTRPDFGEGDYEQKYVDQFTDYLHYLIPEIEEYEYFLDWLAAKYNNYTFRGAGVLMVAAGTQGTGRGTLSLMLYQIFGQDNVMEQDLEKMLASPYTEWELTPLNIVNETSNMNPNGIGFFKAYEQLKQIVDLNPKTYVVNPKVFKNYVATTYSSYLMYSNNSRAQAIATGDRRIYAIRNPSTPAPPEYFTYVRAWMDEEDPHTNVDQRFAPKIWTKHVARWLGQREPDMNVLLAPPPMTDAKADMIALSQSDLEKAVRTIMQIWPSRYITNQLFQSLLATVVHRLNVSDKTPHAKIAWNIIMDNSFSIPRGTENRITINGKRCRPRVLTKKVPSAELSSYSKKLLSELERKQATKELTDVTLNHTVLLRDLNAMLDEMDVGD